METCIECYSTNISALEIDFNCDGCSLVECEDVKRSSRATKWQGSNTRKDVPRHE